MATVRFALVGVSYISEEHARLSGPPHHKDTLGEGTIFSFPAHVCLEPVVAGTQSCQNHLAGPVKKVHDHEVYLVSNWPIIYNI